MSVAARAMSLVRRVARKLDLQAFRLVAPAYLLLLGASLAILPTGRSGAVIEGRAAFGLATEPWLYVLDAGGVVAYRVEGLFTEAEVEAQLQALLAAGYCLGAAGAVVGRPDQFGDEEKENSSCIVCHVVCSLCCCLQRL